MVPTPLKRNSSNKLGQQSHYPPCDECSEGWMPAHAIYLGTAYWPNMHDLCGDRCSAHISHGIYFNGS